MAPNRLGFLPPPPQGCDGSHPSTSVQQCGAKGQPQRREAHYTPQGYGGMTVGTSFCVVRCTPAIQALARKIRLRPHPAHPALPCIECSASRAPLHSGEHSPRQARRRSPASEAAGRSPSQCCSFVALPRTPHSRRHICGLAGCRLPLPTRSGRSPTTLNCLHRDRDAPLHGAMPFAS